MAESFSALADFPGVGVRYEIGANPFFEAICKDTLRRITSVALGKELMKRIADAKPGFRGDFPSGINVILKPLVTAMQYNQAGFKPVKNWGQGGAFKVDNLVPSAHAAHSLTRTNDDGSKTKCAFWKDGTSVNEAVNNTFTTGAGTVCFVRFSNAQFMTSKGDLCHAYIVLAHELIHSMHCLEGTHKGDEEEVATAGEGRYATDPMTEAAFRRAFGIAQRAAYF